MFRTFALCFALVTGLGAMGYAQNMRGFQPMGFKNPRVLGGQVNADGSVAQGSHFTVVHLGTGEYELTLNERYFPNGCPIVTISGINSLTTVRLFPQRCNVYQVDFAGPNGKFLDTEFNLIAVASQ